MKFGKRRKEADGPDRSDATVSVSPTTEPSHEPVAGTWAAQGGAASAEPVADEEPVVEGEAVELPPVAPGASADAPSVPLTVQETDPRPDPMPFPVADEPVAVAGSASGPTAGAAPVTSLGDSAEGFASGHAAAPGGSWQEPLMELADERPELVVAAAFAGGILAAMILRRLGS